LKAAVTSGLSSIHTVMKLCWCLGDN